MFTGTSMYSSRLFACKSWDMWGCTHRELSSVSCGTSLLRRVHLARIEVTAKVALPSVSHLNPCIPGHLNVQVDVRARTNDGQGIRAFIEA